MYSAAANPQGVDLRGCQLEGSKNAGKLARRSLCLVASSSDRDENIGSSMSKYIVNVNMPNNKAVIHLADSHRGTCKPRVKEVAGGGWYGPYNTLEEAKAQGPRCRVRSLWCKLCLHDAGQVDNLS